ncbi:MAG: hypothetical protein ACI4TC_04410, partial [Kiritimatiellia bacterium]
RFTPESVSNRPTVMHEASRNTSGSCAHRSERTKGAHPDPAGFVADPEKFRLLRKIDRRDETILSLRRQLSAKDAPRDGRTKPKRE